MGKRNENVNQHYVPQAYYRNFSLNRNGVKVYDWQQDRIFTQSISSISSEDYFYDVDADIMPIFINLPKMNEQLVDKTIKQYVEDSIGVVLNNFVAHSEELSKLKHGKSVTFKDQMGPELRKFLIVQLIRTPRFRKVFEQMAKATQEELARYDFSGTVIERLTASDWIKITHNIFLFGVVYRLSGKGEIPLNDSYKPVFEKLYTLVDGLMTGMLYGGLTFFHSETDLPFITSDNPVSIEWTDEKRFSMIFLPLNPRFAILLFDREAKRDMIPYDRAIYVVDDKKKNVIENLNLLTTCSVMDRLIADTSYNFIEERKFIKGERRMKVVL
ncbi:DUF4238 domain-containing protein [Lentibacillus salicampi]|uniref:DUF4238 domain-containing protein n=1 Tax=Lentibacillus salicampi TaxID=175306 RepID=A0A4Y9A6D0_9BACI|nr:DUF4238 domain-containing protein [Lentibacillus salicampi]TFJ90688.1 DUF4238 domain-containing protein [Lentibacillus salicampi]